MTETNATESSALHEPEFEESQGTYYGQHKNMVYVLGTLAALVIGAGVGYLVLPDDWALYRRLGGGAFMGLWCGYCIFAWRFLFYGTVD